MKFRTELKIAPLKRTIDLSERIVTLGSCFATAISEALSSQNLRIVGNPLGPLFNPASIASALRRAMDGRRFTAEELSTNAEGERFSFDASTHFTDPSGQALLERLNATNDRLREAVTEARWLIFTFGTAWVYRLQTSGEVVANCHREPLASFRRERLTVEEILTEWKQLIEGPLADKQIILTLSPIRHLGDGLQDNAVSKATLRLAIEELVSAYDNVHYFPAYELLIDDLRDYRFYAEDLVHPSRQAVAYIVERFTEFAFSSVNRAYLDRIDHVLNFCRHRPLHPHSESHRQGVKRTLDELYALQEEVKIDFSEQIHALEAQL